MAGCYIWIKSKFVANNRLEARYPHLLSNLQVTPQISGCVETLPALAVALGAVKCCMGSDGTVLVGNNVIPPSVAFSRAIVGVWIFSDTPGEKSSLSADGEGVEA